MLTPLFLDFLPIAVPVRVDYRVATEAKANGLNQAWLVLLSRDLYRIAHRITYRQDIGAIHTPALHIVSARLAVQLTYRGSLVNAQAHAILVVDHKVDDGQLIDLGEVERFVEGSCIGCAITHLAGHDLRGAAIGDGKGGTSGEGNLTPDDGISTHKVTFEVKEMHGAAAPMRAACFLAE